MIELRAQLEEARATGLNLTEEELFFEPKEIKTPKKKKRKTKD